jgi:hypothetical protein
LFSNSVFFARSFAFFTSHGIRNQSIRTPIPKKPNVKKYNIPNPGLLNLVNNQQSVAAQNIPENQPPGCSKQQFYNTVPTVILATRAPTEKSLVEAYIKS